MLWLALMSDAPAWLSELAAGSLEEVSEVEGESLVVTSGRLVGCDPLVYLNAADPFTRRIPAGEYKVRVGELDGQSAYARLVLSDGPIASWEVARCPGEEDVEGWPGYGVDSGIGCFVDFGAVQHFIAAEEELSKAVSAKVVEEGVDTDDVLAHHAAFERIRAEIGGEDPLATVEAALATKPTVSVKLAPDANLIAFRSGIGDGVYASFWGLDAKGEPVALVTDFGIFGESEDGDEGLADDLEEELAALSSELGLDDEEMEGGDLGGLERLAAALGLAKEPEPEVEQGPSPLFLQSKALLESWVRTEKIELEPEVNLDAFAEAFLEKLVSLSGHRNPGSHIADWLLERAEVADVFATDDDLERDLVR